MTERERNSAVTLIEKSIREFKIVTDGTFQIMGGFGRLPVSEKMEDRVTNIERSINQFTIEGAGVRVDGTLDTGYSVFPDDRYGQLQVNQAIE